MAKANMSLTKNAMPTQDAQVRAHNFDEVALGYSEETAIENALYIGYASPNTAVIESEEYYEAMCEYAYEGENGENAKVGIVVNNESIVGTAVMTWEDNASPNFANLPVLIYLDNSANRTFELVLESGKIYLRETTPVAP